MITLHPSKCEQCGVCVEICHESCLVFENGRLRLEEDSCSTCTQCIAICPTLAITWDGIPPEPFQPAYFPSSVQIEELLKRRRTNRHFKPTIPERKLIAAVVNYGVYAPKHNHDFRVIAVDDSALLETVDQVMYRYNRLIYRVLYQNPLIPLLVRLVSPSQQDEFQKARPKLEHSLQIGRAYASLPPVLVFIVGKKGIPLSQESAQYMLYSMDLFARTKGLGCRILVGNQMFFNHSKELKHTLGINKGERLYATAGFGYPAKHFRNKVEGRKLPLTWCDS